MIGCCTLKESIATLEHSHLATVVVEGSDDMKWYRWLEGAIQPDVSILPVGGRATVLEIFQDRERFKIPIAFLADKDLWLFQSIPKEYESDLILTSGYSIENDILVGSGVEKLFTPEENQLLKRCFSELSTWYFTQVLAAINGHAYKLDCALGSLLDLETFTLRQDVRANCCSPQTYNALYEDILNNFTVKFRGKTLLELYAYLLQHRCNSQDPTYHKKALIEIATKTVCGESAKNIVSKIKEKLSASSFYSSDSSSPSRDFCEYDKKL